jgi:hypothetical protein
MCSMYQNKARISYKRFIWGLGTSLWQLQSSMNMKIIHISLAGNTFSRMMNCDFHFQIYTVHIQTFLNRYSECPPCTLAHIAPLFITDHTQSQSSLGHMFLRMLFFLYLSQIWPCFSETPCVLSQVSRRLGLLHLFMHKSSTWSLMEMIAESVRVEGGTA